MKLGAAYCAGRLPAVAFICMLVWSAVCVRAMLRLPRLPHFKARRGLYGCTRKLLVWVAVALVSLVTTSPAILNSYIVSAPDIPAWLLACQPALPIMGTILTVLVQGSAFRALGR